MGPSADAASSGANAAPETFSDSLAAAGKAALEAGTASGTNTKVAHGGKSSEVDAERPAALAATPHPLADLLVQPLPLPLPASPEPQSILSMATLATAEVASGATDATESRRSGDPNPLQSGTVLSGADETGGRPSTLIGNGPVADVQGPKDRTIPAQVEGLGKTASRGSRAESTAHLLPVAFSAENIPAAEAAQNKARPSNDATANAVSLATGADSPARPAPENSFAPASVDASVSVISSGENSATPAQAETATEQAVSVAVSAAVAAPKPMSENPDPFDRLRAGSGHPASLVAHNVVVPTGSVRGQGTSAVGAKDNVALKHPEKAASGATASRAELQTTAQVGGDQGAGGQTQRDNSSPTPSVVAAQASSNDAVASNVHAVAVMPSMQQHEAVHAAAPAPAATATPLSAQVPAPQPVINMAKLIQSVGQTEMRVGLRSEEFGTISIRTSSTRDSISTQISVDHSELASALSTHVPEMQTRLGGSQTATVQIDFSGHNAGQSGSLSNGSASDSRGSRQQEGAHAANGYGSNGDARPFVPAAIVASDSGARLDIRV